MKSAIAKIATLLACLSLSPLVSAQAGNSAALLNPNTTEPAVLKTLPHVTEQVAQAIVAGRPYPTTAAFNDVLAKSLTEAQRTELYGRLFLPINLNTASRAEIMLIPGMTNRMVREFEEYRPYKNIEQFRREIGKYVDAKEVARLESYVTLK
jgi:DNA uptake protein ComE-like DNA-binding protein